MPRVVDQQAMQEHSEYMSIHPTSSPDSSTIGSNQHIPCPDRFPLSAVIHEAIDSFRKALPELIDKHRGEWVAYHGKTLLAFATSQRALYKVCKQRGIPLNDVLVRNIRPEAPSIIRPEEYRDV